MKYPPSLPALLTEIESLSVMGAFTFNDIRENIQQNDIAELASKRNLLNGLLSKEHQFDGASKGLFSTLSSALETYETNLSEYIDSQLENTVNQYNKEIAIPEFSQAALECHPVFNKLLCTTNNLNGLYLKHNEKNLTAAQDAFSYASTLAVSPLDKATTHANYLKVTNEQYVATPKNQQHDIIGPLFQSLQENYQSHYTTLDTLDTKDYNPRQQKTLATLYNSVGRFVKASKTRDDKWINIAKECYEKAYQLWPQSNVMCNNYAIYLYQISSSPNELQKAINIFQQVIDRNPGGFVANDYQVRTCTKVLALQATSQDAIRDTLFKSQSRMDELVFKHRAKKDNPSYDEAYIESKSNQSRKNKALTRMAAEELQRRNQLLFIGAHNPLTSTEQKCAKRKFQKFTGENPEVSLERPVNSSTKRPRLST